MYKVDYDELVKELRKEMEKEIVSAPIKFWNMFHTGGQHLNEPCAHFMGTQNDCIDHFEKMGFTHLGGQWFTNKYGDKLYISGENYRTW